MDKPSAASHCPRCGCAWEPNSAHALINGTRIMCLFPNPTPQRGKKQYDIVQQIKDMPVPSPHPLSFSYRRVIHTE